MRKQKVVSGWVIYHPRLSNGGPCAVAVCEQEEWDEMELAEPGRHELVRSGIAGEAEADAVARGMQVIEAVKGKTAKPKPK